MEGRRGRLLFDAVLLGVVGAAGAQLFIFLLEAAEALLLIGTAGYTRAGPGEVATLGSAMLHGSTFWLIPVVTTFGGLVSGILVYRIAPEAEGHGTDTVVRAYHYARGSLRARVAPLKAVTSAITIGSGGAAGREGPTTLISAGLGSIYANLTERTEEERSLLVLMGTAAGLSAIFRSPIGTAVFAIEVLYSEMELESSALLYTMLAAIVAYTLNALFTGWEPLFHVPANLVSPQFFDYLSYVGLGVAAGGIATVLPWVFYQTRDLFRRLPVARDFKPAIGGLGLGLIGVVWPQVLGGGYNEIQDAIDGRMAIELLAVLIAAKMIAFALTVASGGSGGVFAPSLFVGAMLGGALAPFFGQPAAAFAIVGMAAVFAGAARVPFATLLMVTEMTGGYALLVPAGLAVMLSFLVQYVCSSHLKYRSLYEDQVPRPSDSPAHFAEYLGIALGLLNRHRKPLEEQVGQLDLVRILQLGVPVRMPGGKRLTVWALREDSPSVGSQIKSGRLLPNASGALIVAILRNGQLILPHGDTVVEARDQMLVLGTPETWHTLSEQCDAMFEVPSLANGTSDDRAGLPKAS